MHCGAQKLGCPAEIVARDDLIAFRDFAMQDVGSVNLNQGLSTLLRVLTFLTRLSLLTLLICHLVN